MLVGAGVSLCCRPRGRPEDPFDWYTTSLAAGYSHVFSGADGRRAVRVGYNRSFTPVRLPAVPYRLHRYLGIIVHM